MVGCPVVQLVLERVARPRVLCFPTTTFLILLNPRLGASRRRHSVGFLGGVAGLPAAAKPKAGRRKVMRERQNFVAENRCGQVGYRWASVAIWWQIRRGALGLSTDNPAVQSTARAQPCSASRRVARASCPCPDRTGVAASRRGSFCQGTHRRAPNLSRPTPLVSEMATTLRALASAGTRIGCPCPDRTGVARSRRGSFCQGQLMTSSR